MDIDSKEQILKNENTNDNNTTNTTNNTNNYEYDETCKTSEALLRSLFVTEDGLPQDQKNGANFIASRTKQSEARVTSATRSQHPSTFQSSHDYSHCDLDQNLAHCNTFEITESGFLTEKQSLAVRQDIVSITKQGAFSKDATFEEMTPDLQDDSITGSTHADGLFCKEITIQEATMGVNDDTVNSLHLYELKAMLDGSKGYNDDMNPANNTMAHNSHPLNQLADQSHDPMMSNQRLQTTLPGALAIFPTVSAGSGPPTLIDDTTSMQYESQLQHLTPTEGGDIEAHEPALKAVLVTEDPGVLASATLLDIEAEKRFHQRRRMRTMVGTLIITSIIAIAVAIPVVLTRPGPPPATFSPSSSPGPSATPSFLPTVRSSIQPSWLPSSSPSSGLFGFLAENSYDGGIMLAIAGSSQQRAMDWLLEMSGLSELGYNLLQSYALVTLYFETYGEQWFSTISLEDMRLDLEFLTDYQNTGEWLDMTPSVNPTGFCNWKGVLCNYKREIESLTLSSNNLLGSLPAELAMLHQSLSKSTIFWE